MVGQAAVPGQHLVFRAPPRSTPGRLSDHFRSENGAATRPWKFISLPSSKGTFSRPFKEKCISKVVRIAASIIIFITASDEKPSSPYYVVLYFWWGCRGNLNLITLGSERVNSTVLDIAGVRATSGENSQLNHSVGFEKWCLTCSRARGARGGGHCARYWGERHLAGCLCRRRNPQQRSCSTSSNQAPWQPTTWTSICLARKDSTGNDRQTSSSSPLSSLHLSPSSPSYSSSSSSTPPSSSLRSYFSEILTTCSAT